MIPPRSLARSLLAAVMMTLVASTATPAPAATVDADRPNVILVVTDDQRWDTMDSMPWLRRHARRNAAWFGQAYAPLPQCCPARATLLTGMYPHNHNVWKSAPSIKPGALGGHAGISQVEAVTIATLLDDAGYSTSLVGKYSNGYPAYGGSDGEWRAPPGWDEWAAIFQPGPLDFALYGEPDPVGKGYLSFNISRGADGRVDHIDHFRSSESMLYRRYPDLKEPEEIPLSGDVHSTLAYGQLARQSVRRNAAEPFFLWLNFTAPHLRAIPTDASAGRDVAMVDRSVNGFTENHASEEELVAAGKPAWVRALPPLDSYSCDAPYSPSHKCADAASSLEMERSQRRTILDVDKEMRKLFKTLANTLDENGRPLIETTYVIFTSDHGFMWGEHRIPHNKGVPYQESIAVPFLVFGPDVEAGKKPTVVSLVDVVPTIIDWAGLDRSAVERTGHLLDGESLTGLLTGAMPAATFRSTVRAGVLVESRSRNAAYTPEMMEMPGWRAIATTRWKVMVYHRNHRTVVDDPHGISMEMYDLVTDPYELQSLAGAESLPSGLRRAMRYLKRLKTCGGVEGDASCSIPGSSLR